MEAVRSENKRRENHRIIWNTSHHEFTVFDYYYFSSLERFLKSRFVLIENKKPLDETELNPSDILVVNYPEVEFSSKEKDAVRKFIEDGGRLVVAAYYQNEDSVASICSDLLNFAGVSFGEGSVATEEEGLLTTARTTEEARKAFSNIKFERVYFPCSCPVYAQESLPLLEVEGQTVACLKRYGKGEIIALGTAVFWDNFAVDREDNWKFVEWLFV